MNRNLVYSGFFLFGLLVFLPALSSYFYLDDYAFLTFSRYIRNPLSFFNHDHFPGSFFYRPLGMLLWWITYHLFGLNNVLHNLVNILIHVGSTCVLFRIFCLTGGDRKLNILTALLFLAHPLTMSTIDWLSDRFDILATLFILLTVYWFLRYRLDNNRRYYYLALASSVLAILSKELAYLTPLFVTIIAVGFHKGAKPSRNRMLNEIAPFFALMLVLFGMRVVLLRSTENLFWKGDTMLHVIAGGVSRWLHFLPDFFTFYSNYERFHVVAYLMLGLAMLLILVIPAAWALIKWREINWGIITLGLAIVLLPAILQAPVMNSSLMVTPDGKFSFVVLACSRFYYLSFAGFVILVNQLLNDTVFTSVNGAVRVFGTRMISSSLVFMVVCNAILSYSLGNHWNKLTNGPDRYVIEQAILALDKVKLPERDCKLYFLNTHPASWTFREFSDSAVKALARPDSPVIHCLVESEKAPWYNIMLRADLGAMQIAPLQDVIVAGKPFAPTLIDRLAYVYVKIPNTDAVATDPNAVFLEFDGNRFVDVSQQIRSRTKLVNFFDDR